MLFANQVFAVIELRIYRFAWYENKGHDEKTKCKLSQYKALSLGR